MAGIRELLRRARRLGRVPSEKETELLEIMEGIEERVKQDERDGIVRDDSDDGPLSKEETERRQAEGKSEDWKKKKEGRKYKPRPVVKWVTKYITEEDDDMLDATFRHIHGYDKVNLCVVDTRETPWQDYLYQAGQGKPRVRDHVKSSDKFVFM